MSNLIEISPLIKKKSEEDNAKKLELQASYTALEMCLKTLEISKLPELRDVKISIKRVMKELYNKKIK